ncbi:MAG: cytochrome P450 [Actinomycetota bacterium]
MGLPPASRRDLDLPGTSYRRGLRARAATDVLIQQEIDRRRAETTETRPRSPSTDVLGSILEVADHDGSGAVEDEAPLSDDEIRDQVRGLIAAGYDTTSSAASWLVYALARHPDALEAMREQVSDVLGDRPPTIDDLRQLDTVDAVVRETLRLWPPAAVGLRRAVDPFEVLGHTIAGGTNIVYSPYVTHRLPEIWDDPTSFRPERWRGDEPESGAYLPFGDGARRCLGFALATLELQVLAVRLAQFGTWRLTGGEVRPSGFANLAPDGGMPIAID